LAGKSRRLPSHVTLPAVHASQPVFILLYRQSATDQIASLLTFYRTKMPYENGAKVCEGDKRLNVRAANAADALKKATYWWKVDNSRDCHSNTHRWRARRASL
jgi:hypothetical protein